MRVPPVLPGVALVVGLGLIGGSLAALMRASGFAGEVRGFDSDAATRARALELGLVDSVSPVLAEALSGVGLVVVAVPTLAVESVLSAVREHAPRGVFITDVASVKGSVLDAARRVFGELPAGLVPGHPIAGSERSGVEAASPGLFRDHRVILTPHEGSAEQALDCVRQLWTLAGASVVCMGAHEHDRLLAFTSHLPHALAFTLVNVLSRQDASEDIFRFAAGGFRDFTRIASSDPVMWRDISLANRSALLDAIDEFAKGLSELRGAVEFSDGERLHAAFSAANGVRGRYLQTLVTAAHDPSAEPGEGA